MNSVRVTNRDWWLLGRLLVETDTLLDRLDSAVFEAAFDAATHTGLDSQRNRALREDFQPPVKQERNRILEQRNALARVLGFRERKANHDFAPRGYVIEPDQFIRPT